MPNFVKISRQMKKLSIQALDSNRPVCMAAICFNGPMLALPTNEQLFREKRTCAKFQIDIDYLSKTEGLVRVCTNRQTDITKLTQFVIQKWYYCIITILKFI